MQNVRKLITNLDFSGADQTVNDLLALSESSFVCFADEDKQEIENDYKNSSEVLLIKTKLDNVEGLLSNSDISNDFDMVYVGLKAEMNLSIEEFSNVSEKMLTILGKEAALKQCISFIDDAEELNDIIILAIKK